MEDLLAGDTAGSERPSKKPVVNKLRHPLSTSETVPALCLERPGKVVKKPLSNSRCPRSLPPSSWIPNGWEPEEKAGLLASLCWAF